MHQQDKKNYLAPRLKVVAFKVERGFALSIHHEEDLLLLEQRHQNEWVTNSGLINDWNEGQIESYTSSGNSYDW